MTPTTEQELAEAIISANEPIDIRGGGTRLVRGGAPLHTTGLSGITLYEPGALTMVARAGTPLSDITAALDAENQQLAFEPPDMRGLLGTAGIPTIGGVFATNASGPRRIAVGAARDFLLGVRFVDGSGNIIKNGGRVMKNVTGYDLVKLLAGSWGTLGVLSEVSFKVLPKPEVTTTLFINGLSDQDACAAMQVAMSSPYDVTGAAHDPMPGHTPITFIRVEGFADSVAYRSEKLKTLLSKFGGDIHLSDDPTDWATIRDSGNLVGEGDIWRISIKPTDGPVVAKRIDAKSHIFDWGGGLLWVRVAEGTDVRAKMGDVAGHATLVRGSEAITSRFGIFHKQDKALDLISAGLRQKFDPRGILNPGRMG